MSKTVAVGASGVLVALVLPGQVASAAYPTAQECRERANDTYAELFECVTLPGVRAHQAEFQRIADASTDPVWPGTRAAGTDGYAKSVEYVSSKLEEAGYRVTLDPVEIVYSFPAVLRQLTPVEAEYETGPFTGSGAGVVEGQVIPVDISLDPPRASTSGCEASDFDPALFTGPADIALVQRGTCFFGDKAANAEAAGAEAVIIFNQGNDPTREGLIVADATSVTGAPGPVTHGIPVVGASFADGEALAQSGSTAFIEVIEPEIRTDYNVIADLRGRDRNNVVMAGAHLDSVTEGPGINDNGSGSAAILETALQLAKIKPENSLRFAWWAGEEQGLVGSADYVAGLSKRERDKIALYMNYDMVGSPNYVFMVYDSNESTFPAPEGITIPEGSQAIEDLYERFYTRVGEPYDDTEFSGRSDYQAFIEAGIPSGGLFTGAEVIKTEEQKAIWRGRAGQQFDPCYHLACDTFRNNNNRALRVNSNLIAYSMLTFAYSTESVNGDKGKPVPGDPFPLPEAAGPEGTFAGEIGGGLHDHEHDLAD